MTSPVIPLSKEQLRLIFEYRALRSGLGQDEAPESFFFTPSPKIKKVAAGQLTTTMRFSEFEFPTEVTLIILRYPNGTSTTRPVADVSAAEKELANVIFDEKVVVELQAGATPLDIFAPDVVVNF